MLNAPNFQWRSTDPYRELDRGTGAWGVKDVTPGVPEIIVATEDFETDPISGSGTWTISLLTPHTGLRCLRSGVIIANQDTDYTFNIPATATAVRFWWRVSSENNFDWFRVYKDAIIPGNLLMQASGLTDTYEQATLDITGATTVTFRYIKDGSASAGLDRAIIDDIEWIIPGTPAIQLYEPFHLNEDNCVKVVLCDNEVTVTGTVETRPLSCETDSVTVCIDDPITITGEVNTRPLSCETDSVTVCIDDVVIVSGTVTLEDPISITGNIETRELDCSTDSVTICPGEQPIVVVPGTCFPVNVRLDCEVDSVTVCQDENPFGVTGTVEVTNLYEPGTLANGSETAVGAAAVQVLAANANRKACLIQNVGAANVRVGVSGVTATTGFRLVPGQIVVLEMPFVPVQAIFSIREGLISSTVLTQEIT